MMPLKPNTALCLAVIYRVRVTANIPLDIFIEWLWKLNATIILEFVGRDDEMFQKLLANSKMIMPITPRRTVCWSCADVSR